jgi:hypothetical protein
MKKRQKIKNSLKKVYKRGKQVKNGGKKRKKTKKVQVF